ncbi:Alkyl hydroperoxide reductase subunit AhpC (peroxiredoxin) [Terribacillus halophilus]|uniref:Alkyl hydroperoxide reductase subunit AhpC (Peroxiredoxin) n=1 Tax=Terribacillus halophilus TaxID=361279 RepID=A0A1G6NMB6_9BACI|nr:peroxiredoxin [Terribacillus halophilus]SDC68791.1 Alkyl hydroperoxide reductase subunit AhpC (peroxiredoxin) [Terribacillus halophilus]
MIGNVAPQFELPAVLPDGKTAVIRLKQKMEAKKWLVLFFYPRDFSTVCPTELNDLADRIDEVRELDAEVVAISTDSLLSHADWQKIPREHNGIQHISYPLASDFTGNVSQAYGVLDSKSYTSVRATIIVNPQGEICYYLMHADLVGRDTSELLRVLEALQTGEACGVNWHPGDELLPKEDASS